MTTQELYKKMEALMPSINYDLFFGISHNFDVVENNLYKYYSSKLESNISVNLRKSFEDNLRSFSKAKTKRFEKDLKAAKIDVPDINDYKVKTEIINNKYNQVWAKTEGDLIKNKTFGAQKWEDYSNLPADTLIEYVTAGDEKVRESHRKLDGKRFPRGHKFWKSYYPAIDYGCRCTTKVVYDDSEESKDYPEIKTDDKGVEKNPAISGKIFNKKHPYYERN